MKNTNIAFVTPSMRYGGRERVLSILVNYFTEQTIGYM